MNYRLEHRPLHQNTQTPRWVVLDNLNRPIGAFSLKRQALAWIRKRQGEDRHRG